MLLSQPFSELFPFWRCTNSYCTILHHSLNLSSVPSSTAPQVYVGAGLGFALCLCFGVGFLALASLTYQLFEGDNAPRPRTKATNVPGGTAIGGGQRKGIVLGTFGTVVCSCLFIRSLDEKDLLDLRNIDVMSPSHKESRYRTLEVWAKSGRWRCYGYKITKCAANMGRSPKSTGLEDDHMLIKPRMTSGT